MTQEEVAAAKTRTYVLVNLMACARCGCSHSLKFKKLTVPSAPWTHWAMCPAAAEPIMLAFVADGTLKGAGKPAQISTAKA